MEVSRDKQIKFYKAMIDELDDEMLKNNDVSTQEKYMQTKQAILRKLRNLRGL